MQRNASLLEWHDWAAEVEGNGSVDTMEVTWLSITRSDFYHNKVQHTPEHSLYPLGFPVRAFLKSFKPVKLRMEKRIPAGLNDSRSASWEIPLIKCRFVYWCWKMVVEITLPINNVQHGQAGMKINQQPNNKESTAYCHCRVKTLNVQKNIFRKWKK